MPDGPTILPPLIVHDGSKEGRRFADILAILVPWAEVIDARSKEGGQRIDEINRGLLDGTLDTREPPICVGVDTEFLKERLRA